MILLDPAPLLEAVPGSAREQAEALGVSRRQVHRWRAGAARLPATTADVLAVRAGHHPFELWPDTWGDC